MPCTPIDLGGGSFAIVCGRGAYQHLVLAACPWCCLGAETTVHAFREVHGGWCAPDLLCGTCGQYHTSDDDRLHKFTDEIREENKAKVQALMDAGVVVGPWPSPSAFDDDEAGDSEPGKRE